MPKTKISEFSSTPANNTDIDSINISEGCAPSGINDAIRELMAQLKDWQSGTSNDPMVIGSSGSLTLNQGTANGVTYLNGSKVVTSGSTFQFDGSGKLSLGNVAHTSFIPTTVLTLGNSGENAEIRMGQADTKALISKWVYNATVGNAYGSLETYGQANYIQFGASDFRWQTASSEKMRLDSSGNLGLGVTPSAWLSSYKSLDIGSGGASVYGGSSFAGLAANYYVNTSGQEIYKTSNYATQYVQVLGSHRWYNAPSGTAGNSITFTQAMTLDASGNLGVGTTSPSQLLDVRGTSSPTIKVRNNTATTDTYAQFLFEGANTFSGTSTSYIRSITSNAGNSSTALTFGTNADGGGAAAERARIDSSGNLLLGLTSGSGTFSRTLDIQGTSSAGINLTCGGAYSGAGINVDGSTSLVFRNAGAERGRFDAGGNFHVGETAHTDGSMFYNASNSTLNAWRGSTTASDGLYGVYSNIGGSKTVRGYFRCDGGLANYSANNVNLSDERLKKDIALAGNYLDKICAIPVKNFRYKDQSASEDITLGVIAQDVLSVAPELVSREGFGLDDKEEFLSVYQTDLQYALMKCIQEMKTIIDDQAARIATLEAK